MTWFPKHVERDFTFLSSWGSVYQMVYEFRYVSMLVLRSAPMAVGSTLLPAPNELNWLDPIWAGASKEVPSAT